MADVEKFLDIGAGLYNLDPSIAQALDDNADVAGTGIKAILMVLDADGLFEGASVETLDRYIDLAEHPFKCLLVGASTPLNAGPLALRLDSRNHIAEAFDDGAGEAPDAAQE